MNEIPEKLFTFFAGYNIMKLMKRRKVHTVVKTFFSS